MLRTGQRRTQSPHLAFPSLGPAGACAPLSGQDDLHRSVSTSPPSFASRGSKPPPAPPSRSIATF